MSKFNDIQSFEDYEVNDALQNISRHPMMKALMQFTFPDQEESFWLEKFKKIHSISDFQRECIAYTVRQILKQSSEGLTTSGFEKLDKDTAYLFISNHRDIVLDTCLLNLVLLDKGLIMTSSAIGDNLVKKNFLHVLAKLNRNFLVQRGLSIREQLNSSSLMSEYIYTLLKEENRSVWIAQREGRTKDGNDSTQQGVLKMLAMSSDKESLPEFFRSLKIVPLSISYEYDPTDALKMPQAIAESKNEVYIKDENEDFRNILSGVLGQKKRIHIHAGDVLDSELSNIDSEVGNKNKQLQAIANSIDNSIIKNYKLWPTNYIASDLLNRSDKCAQFYSDEEKKLFMRRLDMRIDSSDQFQRNSFLAMYANPVLNKENIFYNNGEEIL